MTEPLRKYSSSDVPEYSSYPAEPDRASAEVVEFTVISEFDAMPQEEISNPYEEPARRVGAALGRLVNSLQNIAGPVQSKVTEQYERAEDGVTLAKEAAENAYEDATRNIGHMYEDARQKVSNVARQSVCQARARANDLRRQAVRTIDEYPAHTLAAVGIAGIGIGIGLRAWRESRD
jgi:hypothetical protein